jgi:hypothetical protein
LHCKLAAAAADDDVTFVGKRICLINRAADDDAAVAGDGDRLTRL